MRTVHLTLLTGLLTGLLAAVLLLAAVAATADLTDLGWAVGLLVAAGTSGLLARALVASGAVVLGGANAVTLTRATLAAAVAAVVADSLVAPSPGAASVIVILTVPALMSDAVDGAVARRTGTVTTVGARFDMEVDAFLIMVLCVFVARSAGPWVLAIGLARYAFVAAAAALPWLRNPLPPRNWRKVVAAAAGVVLTFAAAGVGSAELRTVLLLVTAGLLAESFGRDVMWLWSRRAPLPARPGPTSDVELDRAEQERASVVRR